MNDLDYEDSAKLARIYDLTDQLYILKESDTAQSNTHAIELERQIKELEKQL